MKNRRGFTLVELLAMMVVLGVLMAITIPNITGILNKSKEENLIADATKMVESAKIKITTHKTGYDKIPKLEVGKCRALSLDYLNSNEDIGNGPNDGTYLNYDSYVLYKLVDAGGGSRKYEYYVRLVEKKDNKYYGIDFVNYDELDKGNYKPRKINVIHGDEENKIAPSNAEILSEINDVTTCSNSGDIYYK